MISRVARGAMKATKKRSSKQLEFPGLPKRRRWRGKIDVNADGRGILLSGIGVGAAGLGIGEGVRRARSTGKRRKKK